MLASLIICTRNREAQLKACLDYMARLEDLPGGWQLALVDNGSTDTTPNVIRAFAEASTSYPVIAADSGPGPGQERRTGLRFRRHLHLHRRRLLRRPDFLRQVHRVFDTSNAGYLGGRIVLHDPML